MMTNDIELLESQGSIYCLFLSPLGRFLYDAFIVKHEDKYLLDVNKQNASKFLQRLNFYKLHSKVFFALNEELTVIYSDKKLSKSTCHKDPRHSKLLYRSMGYNKDIQGELTQDLYLKDKYNYVIPDGFTDFIHDKSLPPEFGAENLNAISYTKGCYTGQEVISRAKYQGVVRKALYRLEFKNAIDEDLSGEEIFHGEVKIGIITSNWRNFAIALLKSEYVL